MRRYADRHGGDRIGNYLGSTASRPSQRCGFISIYSYRSLVCAAAQTDLELYTLNSRHRDVRVGVRVLFGKWSGTEIKLEGEDLMVMKEEGLVGVVEKAAWRKAG